jgi:hypothetical protein
MGAPLMRTFWSVLLLIILSAVQASAQYFPNKSVDSRGGEFKNHWYSTQLRALQEPSLFLSAKDPSAESYRFLWLRTFHHPIAIRLDARPDGTSVLTTKVASGAGGYQPGDLSENSSQVLSKEQTDAFRSCLNKLHFWQAPNPVNDQRGTDGSQWIIEGVKHGKYHVVDRWSPQSGLVRELGWMLAFDLAKINIPEKEIY